MTEDDWDDWDDKDDEDWDKPKKPKPKIDVSIRKPTRFKAWEDEVIRDNWRTHTDEQIAEKLSRPIKSIERRRKALGLSKPNGRPSNNQRTAGIYSNPTEYNLSKLTKEDRIKFYKTKFEKNPRYKWIKKVLMDDEIEYYKHKYIEVLDNLDSINMQEEDLLHNMIMKEISIVRLQSRIRMEEEAWSLAEDDDKPPINMGLYRDLNEAEKQYITYQEKLRLTREQRLKIDKEEKVTVTSLVRAFMDAKNREKAGKLAGAMAYGADRCKKDMTKMNFLLGG